MRPRPATDGAFSCPLAILLCNCWLHGCWTPTVMLRPHIAKPPGR
jgi:hypothetical protein